MNRPTHFWLMRKLLRAAQCFFCLWNYCIGVALGHGSPKFWSGTKCSGRMSVSEGWNARPERLLSLPKQSEGNARGISLGFWQNCAAYNDVWLIFAGDKRQGENISSMLGKYSNYIFTCCKSSRLIVMLCLISFECHCRATTQRFLSFLRPETGICPHSKVVYQSLSNCHCPAWPGNLLLRRLSDQVR